VSGDSSNGGSNGEAPIGASPTRITDPLLRYEAKRAAIWVGVIGCALLAVYIAQPLLVIFGGMVFAAMLDGGARLLGRALNIGRGWRLALVILGIAGFFVWLIVFTGSQISRQAAELPAILAAQISQTIGWLRTKGFDISPRDVSSLTGQLATGLGTVSRAIGGVLGTLTTLVVVTIIGIYVASEPRLYERGVAWMLPAHQRTEFYKTTSQMSFAMRRLMFGRLVGMLFEGVFTYLTLIAYGMITGDPIPMAALLGILTGVLAFVPNVGALVSGALMVLVGFSGGAEMGLYTIAVYFVVQNIDGYIVIPMIARKTVDLAPALVLAMQLIMGILFGVLGLFLADPLLAMIKVALERRAAANTDDEGQSEEQAPA